MTAGRGGRAVEPGLSRRAFLARCGVIGAGALIASHGRLAALARAATPAEDLIEAAGPLMKALATDTTRGLVVFAVPGPDPYSQAQGETSPTPGAIEAKADGLVLEALDYFVPMPDSYAQALAAAFRTGVSDQPLPASALDALGIQLEQGAATLDRALQTLLASDAAIPLSLLIALMLNYEASSVNPAAMAGPFPASPFANLKVAEKAKVFENLETAQSDLVAALDENAPEPMRGQMSGLLKYVGGTLLEFAAFTPYAEWGVFDRSLNRATERPVGWEISSYLPGRSTPVDGRNDLLGYYDGHRSAAGSAPRYRETRRRRRRRD
jgi:hypothetical protein